jgi:hypothetical protein
MIVIFGCRNRSHVCGVVNSVHSMKMRDKENKKMTLGKQYNTVNRLLAGRHDYKGN